MRCHACRFGRYQSSDQTFMSQFGDQLIVINNVPARRCDMCAHTVFDEAFTEHLQLFLEQLTATSPRTNELSWPKTNPNLQSWPPARRSS